MGLGGCYTAIKYLLVIFNFIFWIAGLAIVALAIWMLIDPTFYVSMVQDTNDYLISTYILLVAGILLVIVGFIGCCGSFKESSCLLLTFFSLLLIVFVAEIAAGLWGYLNQETLAIHVKNAMKITVEEEYAKIESRKVLFDTFQQKLQCCGAENPKDWSGNTNLNMGVSSQGKNYDIPGSCCRENVTVNACEGARRALTVGTRIDTAVIYERGCHEKVLKAIRDHFGIILAVGGAIAVVQLMGLLFAVILAFAINRSGRHKA